MVAESNFQSTVAVCVSPAVEGGILPPEENARLFGDLRIALRFGVYVDLPSFRTTTRTKMRKTNHAVSGIASSINMTGMLARIG